MSENTPQANAPQTDRPATFAGLTRPQVDQLRQEHGADRIRTLTLSISTGPVQVIVRAPTRLEYERYSETLMKLREGKTAQALSADRTLLLTCTVAPDAERMTTLLDRYPLLVGKVTEHVLNMAGADVEAREETF